MYYHGSVPPRKACLTAVAVTENFCKSLAAEQTPWLSSLAELARVVARIRRRVALEAQHADAANVRFTFYYDAEEPINSNDPGRNVNPEVIYCAFD